MKRAIVVALLLVTASVAQNPAHFNTLTWSWSQGTGDPATGFHVQRASVSGGPYTTVGTINSPTTLTFSDTNVVAGQTWFYVVTAFNAGGDSVPSNEVTCTTPFLAPQPPNGLSGIAK